MRLTQLDLVRASYTSRVSHLLRACPQEILLSLVKEWFEHPQLQPSKQNTSYEEYTKVKSRVGLLDRLVHDWHKGLTLYQIAQIDLTCFMKAMKARQVKKLWRMKPKGKADFATLTLEETRDRVQSLIGIYFKSHVHVQHDDENGTDWIRISIYVHDELSQVPTTYDTCTIIRYPETPFVVRIGNITTARASIIQQVIVQTFDAKSIVEESFLTGNSLPRLDHYVENHASLGAVSQLRLQSNDSNPLQLDSSSSSSNKRPAEEPYVKGREQRRRIVPLDHEVLDGRKRHVADTFGVDVVQGVEKLELHMETPLEDTVDENVMQLLPYQDVKINMNITIKGKNVLGGMRHLMLTGHMDTPVPSWMVAIASRGINKAHIKDGQVLQEVEVDSDEDMDELLEA